MYSRFDPALGMAMTRTAAPGAKVEQEYADDPAWRLTRTPRPVVITVGLRSVARGGTTAPSRSTKILMMSGESLVDGDTEIFFERGLGFTQLFGEVGGGQLRQVRMVERV